MRAFLTRHQLPAFCALAYALSWACWLPLALTGARVTPGGAGVDGDDGDLLAVAEPLDGLREADVGAVRAGARPGS